MPYCSIEEAWAPSIKMAKQNNPTKTKHVSRTYNRLPNRSGPKTRLVKMETPIQTEHEYSDTDEDKDDRSQVPDDHRVAHSKKTYEALRKDNMELLNLVKKLRKTKASSNNIDEVIVYIVSGFIIIFILENLTSIVRKF